MTGLSYHCDSPRLVGRIVSLFNRIYADCLPPFETTNLIRAAREDLDDLT